MTTLFESHMLGDGVVLKNRAVMAPMTRTGPSQGDVPNALMATYYGQRASADLIVTEATDVSPRTKGYPADVSPCTARQLKSCQIR